MEPFHHRLIFRALVPGAGIKNHRAIPDVLTIADNIFHRAGDRFNIKCVQLAAGADLPQRQLHGSVVCRQLADNAVDLAARINGLQPFDIAVAVAKGDPCRNGRFIRKRCSAFGLLNGVHAVKIRKQLHKGLSLRRGPICHAAAQKQDAFPRQNRIGMLFQILNAIGFGVSRRVRSFFRLRRNRDPQGNSPYNQNGCNDDNGCNDHNHPPDTVFDAGAPIFIVRIEKNGNA